jgi:hypothetical protein
MIASTYCLLFKMFRAKSGNILLSTFFIFLVIPSSLLHWLARPHIFSFLLTLAFSWTLDAYQYRHRNYLYLLPLLMLLWVNLHGGFIVGFVLIGVYLAGNTAQTIFSSEGHLNSHRGKAITLAAVLLGCLLASVVNPFGLYILAFPFKLVSDQFLVDHISEFLSPNFHGTMPFRYLLYLTLAIFAVSATKADIIELALIVLFTHLALYSARGIPLFAIVVSPILVKHATLLLDQAGGRLAAYCKRKSANIAAVDSSVRGTLWPVGAALAIAILVASGKIDFRFDDKAHPVAAVEFLKRENLNGRMFNNDAFGDYLIYAAWPQYRVFLDGRSDMYGASVIEEYLKVIQLNPDWEKVLDKYHAGLIFEPANSPLSILLLERKDWRLVYADTVANIFVKNTPENKATIDRFKDVKPVPPQSDA